MNQVRVSNPRFLTIKECRLTQTEAADVLGIKQPNVSSLMRNRAVGFSVGRLMEFLTALRPDVQISVRKMQRSERRNYGKK